MVIESQDLLKVYDRSKNNLIAIYFLVLASLSALLFSLKQPLFFSYTYYFLVTLSLLLFLSSLLVAILVFNGDQLVILIILLAIILAIYFKNLTFNLFLGIIASFIVFLILSVLTIKLNSYGSLKINWGKNIKTLWFFSSNFLMVSLILFLIFAVDETDLSQQDLEKFLSSFDKFWGLLNQKNYLETKITEIVARNLDSRFDEANKQLAIKLYLEELNKKFNLHLNEASTIKNALAEYFFNQLQLLKNDAHKELIWKLGLGLILFLIFQPILNILGLPLSLLTYFFYLIFLKVKLVKIDKQNTEKEVLTI